MTYKQNLTAIASAVIIFNLSSCKYEDGPTISLRSKTARLTGEWQVVKAPDGLDDLDVEMEFEKDGDFSMSMTYEYYGYSYDYDVAGEWEWSDDKEEIEITVDGDEIVFEVKRLTNSELWFEDEDDLTWELEKK